MKRAAFFLATAITLGLSSLPASAQVVGWGYAPPGYDGYIFAYKAPVYTGRPVTAVGVYLVNSRFVHRRVTGPGVVYVPTEWPRLYLTPPS